MSTEKNTNAGGQQKAGLKRKPTGPPRLLLGKSRSPGQNEKKTHTRKQLLDQTDDTAIKDQSNKVQETMSQSFETDLNTDEHISTELQEEPSDAPNCEKKVLRKSRMRTVMRRILSPALTCIHKMDFQTKDQRHSHDVKARCDQGERKVGRGRFCLWLLFRRTSVPSRVKLKQCWDHAAKLDESFNDTSNQLKTTSDAPENDSELCVNQVDTEQLNESERTHKAMAGIHEGPELALRDKGRIVLTLGSKLNDDSKTFFIHEQSIQHEGHLPELVSKDEGTVVPTLHTESCDGSGAILIHIQTNHDVQECPLPNLPPKDEGLVVPTLGLAQGGDSGTPLIRKSSKDEDRNDECEVADLARKDGGTVVTSLGQELGDDSKSTLIQEMTTCQLPYLTTVKNTVVPMLDSKLSKASSAIFIQHQDLNDATLPDKEEPKLQVTESPCPAEPLPSGRHYPDIELRSAINSINYPKPVILVEDVSMSDEENQECLENYMPPCATLSALLSLNARRLSKTKDGMQHQGDCDGHYSELLLTQTALSLVHTAISAAVEQVQMEQDRS